MDLRGLPPTEMLAAFTAFTDLGQAHGSACPSPHLPSSQIDSGEQILMPVASVSDRSSTFFLSKQQISTLSLPPSPTSSDSEDFANAFDNICLSSASSPIPSTHPSTINSYSSTSEDDYSSSVFSDDVFSVDSPYEKGNVFSSSSSFCSFCHARGCAKICSQCSLLCDDYAFVEFVAFRRNDDKQANNFLSTAATSSRLRTTHAQRQVLECVFQTHRQPLTNDVVSQVLQILGDGWTKARLLKWLDNRKFGRKQYSSKRDPILKKKICTTAQEKLLLEAVFSRTLFPSSLEVDALRKNLCEVRPGWSRRRVVQWFTNRRKQLRPVEYECAMVQKL